MKDFLRDYSRDYLTTFSGLLLRLFGENNRLKFIALLITNESLLMTH